MAIRARKRYRSARREGRCDCGIAICGAFAPACVSGGAVGQIEPSGLQIGSQPLAASWSDPVNRCRVRDSNPRPSVYKTAALPLC